MQWLEAGKQTVSYQHHSTATAYQPHRPAALQPQQPTRCRESVRPTGLVCSLPAALTHAEESFVSLRPTRSKHHDDSRKPLAISMATANGVGRHHTLDSNK